MALPTFFDRVYASTGGVLSLTDPPDVAQLTQRTQDGVLAILLCHVVSVPSVLRWFVSRCLEVALARAGSGRNR
jgi:hypothetical protein